MNEAQLSIPSEPLEKTCRIIVRSIGHANAAVIHAVKQVSPGLDKDIASLLYRAPSELINGLEPALAAKIAAHLTEAGLDVVVDDGVDPIISGDGDYEVALCIKDLKMMPFIIKEIAEFLGCEILAARKIACSVPAVLIGNVSQATVDAVRERFKDYDVEIDISHTPSARYDIVARADSPRVRQTICDIIGVDYARYGSSDVFIAVDKGRDEVRGMYEKLLRIGAKIQVCNRDFQRYDIRLDRAEDNEKMRQYLFEIAGIPEKIIPQIFRRLPIVIHSDIPHTEMEKALQALNDLGAEAIGTPLTFQTYTLTVERVDNQPAAVKVLTGIGDISETEAITVLANRSAIPKHYTKIAALWLRQELKKVGAGVGVHVQ